MVLVVLYPMEGVMYAYLFTMKNVIPDRCASKVHMEVSVTACNTHQTVPVNKIKI